MKFGKQFEFHKIPEWSDFYLDYNLLKSLIKDYTKVFKKSIKSQRKHSTKPPSNDKKDEEIKEGEETNLSQSLLRKSHSFKNTPRKITQLPIKNERQTVSKAIVEETEEKNMEANNYMNSLDIITMSLNSEDRGKEFLYSDEEILHLLKEWMKKYQELIFKINTFFENKKALFETEFTSLVNVLNEKIENINKSISSSAFVSKEQNFKKSLQEIRKVKESDELGYAVSWRRAFSQLYSNVSWLHSYCTINFIASQKILKKLKKHFKLFPGTINFYEKMLEFTKSKSFVVQDCEIVNFRRDISNFYSEKFTDGDMNKALSELGERMTPISTKDLALIFFFTGMIFALILTFILLLSIRIKDVDPSIISLFPGFSFSFMFIVCFFGVGINIQVFRKHRINYIYIFDIDPHLRLSQEKIYRVALFLLTLWMLLIIMTYASVHYELFSNEINFVLSLIIIVLLIIIFFWPFHCLYLTFRQAIFKTIFNNLFPIGKSAVKFRDFMFGDVLTSLTRPFQNLYLTICYSFCFECVQRLDYSGYCSKSDITPLIFTLLPYIIRFFQCLNRYYYTRNAWPHLANGLKYLGGITNSFFLWDIDSIHNNYIVVSIGLVATSYLIFWDIVMDWDLGHLKSTNLLLREKLMYPKYYYYWTLISNFILRFTWLINIYIPSSNLYVDQTKMFVFSFLEIFRRIQWSFFRVENENQNNFEKYRTILDIPELPSH